MSQIRDVQRNSGPPHSPLVDRPGAPLPNWGPNSIGAVFRDLGPYADGFRSLGPFSGGSRGPALQVETFKGMDP